jgi:glycosyltransferase involved in cell wall biosynthesis
MSENCVEQSAAHAQSPALRILMVGPDLRVRGGVSAVQRLLLPALPGDITATHVATMAEGGHSRKLLTFLRGLVAVRTQLQRGVDVVHIHFASGASSRRKMMIARLAMRHGVPVILHAHGGGYRRYWARISSLERRLIQQTLRRAQRIIVLGADWRDFYASIGAPRERIEVLPNPVAVPQRLPERLHSGRVRLVHLASLSRDKGSFDLLEALGQLPQRIKAQVHVVAAGTGAVDELRAAALRLGLQEILEVRNWIEADERDRLLASSDVFVLPSYYEGLPMSLLEAMAWGLAPICTPIGSIPEYIEDGVNGLLVRPGAVAELAQKIERVVLDGNLRGQLGRRARATVEPLDVAVYAQRVSRLYRMAAQATGTASTSP